MSDRFDALIAMVAQSIQSESADKVHEINQLGRERAEYLLGIINRLEELVAVAKQDFSRFQHYLPAPDRQPQRVVPKENVQRLAQNG